jgi:hypothetical protein
VTTKTKVAKPKKSEPKVDKSPSWMDDKKTVSATFAFENGHSAYGGFVVDLGDGTCRIANAILLGENSLKWGDQVDLFCNPCAPMDRPYIGYRVYARADEPNYKVPGKNYGAKRKPTKSDKAKRAKAEKALEARQIEQMKKNHEGMMATMDLLVLMDQYSKLLLLVKEKGVEIPAELATMPETWMDERKKRRKGRKA